MSPLKLLQILGDRWVFVRLYLVMCSIYNCVCSATACFADCLVMFLYCNFTCLPLFIVIVLSLSAGQSFCTLFFIFSYSVC